MFKYYFSEYLRPSQIVSLISHFKRIWNRGYAPALLFAEEMFFVFTSLNGSFKFRPLIEKQPCVKCCSNVV